MSAAGAPRLELKTKVSEAHFPEIRMWLKMHFAGFVVAYPPRRVNNIYFDTPLLSSFSENLSGQSERRKLRLRWYGDDDRRASCVVEAKCKRGGIGWKLSCRLPGEQDLSRLKWTDLTSHVRSAAESELDIYLGDVLSPVILNRYTREYYVTMDGRVRVTLDSDQRVHDQRFSPRPNLAMAEPRPEMGIVEFKAPREDGERLSTISASFPVRLEKSSKYVAGVHRLLTV